MAAAGSMGRSVQPESANKEAFYSRVAAAFDAATAKNGGAEDHYFRIAGAVVKLSFATPALVAQVVPALSHLAVEPEPTDLVVGLWDGRTHPFPVLPEDWARAAYMPRGRVGGEESGPVRMVAQPGAGSLSVCHVEDSTAFFWVNDASRVVFWETSAPIRNILHAWFAQRGLFLLHAAALGFGEDAVLLVGKGGSGKSTTALLGLADGLDYLGDDYCLVGCDEGAFRVHSLYASAKICNDNLHRIPELSARIGNPVRPEDEKAVFFLHESPLAGRLAASRRVRAILLPKVSEGISARVEPVPAAAVLAAVSPSTLLQLADADRRDFDFHARLSRAVPGYRLHLCGEQSSITGEIRRILA